MASTLNQVVATGFQEKTCEYKWRILNWLRVQETKEYIYSQKIVIETGGLPHEVSKWEIGFMDYPDRGDLWQLYCKLFHIPGSLDDLECTITIQWANSKVVAQQTFSKRGKVKNKERLETYHQLYGWINGSNKYTSVVDPEGALNLNISIKVMIPHTLASNVKSHVTTAANFSKNFVAQINNNIAALLEDSSSADLKIVTSDGIELPAHKLILKAQCPVFVSMFPSQFSDNITGKVTVEDVSGKTMKILLNFFYTGELLPTWSDEDTIVEFTYAAGKYQMAEVLRMLDSVLGTTDENETSSFDLQLLNMAHKLSLKNAEARLVKRVMNNATKYLNTADLLKFLGNIRIDNKPEENLLVRANPE